MSTPWRERVSLSIAETARLLSVSQSHVRRHFQLIDVYGAKRVLVREVLELLGEPLPEAGKAPAALTHDRRADAQVDRIFASRRR